MPEMSSRPCLRLRTDRDLTSGKMRHVGQWFAFLFMSLLSACSGSTCIRPESATRCPIPVQEESLGPAAPLPKNFGIVSEGVYRGAQPEGKAQYQALHALGVRRILKLNATDDESLCTERKLCVPLGIEVIPLALRERTVGTDAARACVCRALQEIREAQRAGTAIYVHCTAGKNRTGFVVGAYRETEGTRTGARAPDWVLDELRAYGHNWFFQILYPKISSVLREGFPACDN